MIRINDLSLPAPSSLSVRVTPQGGSAQYNTLGKLVQDGMQNKHTVDISWARMPGDTLRRLSQTLSAGGFFSVTYPDPLSGSREMTCRVTVQAARVYQFRAEHPVWADVSLSLEEQ